MKKLFALLFAFTLMIATSAVSAETTSPTTTISTSDNGIVEKAISPENSTTAYVLEKLEEYAKALQVPAEKLFKIIVKQQVVMAVFWGIMLLSSVIILFVLINSIKKSAWGMPDLYDDNDKDSIWWKGKAWNSHATFVIVFGLFFLFTFIGGIANSDYIITGLFNPEYGAINKLLEILK